MEDRRKKLQQYLRKIIELQQQLHPDLSSGVNKGKLMKALPFLRYVWNILCHKFIHCLATLRAIRLQTFKRYLLVFRKNLQNVAQFFAHWSTAVGCTKVTSTKFNDSESSSRSSPGS